MTEQTIAQETPDLYGGTGPDQCLRQVAAMLQKLYGPLRIEVSDAERAFASVPGPEPRPGVSAVRGFIRDEEVLAVQLECARAPGDLRVSARSLFALLAQAGEKCRAVAPPDAPPDGAAGLWLELRVAAAPLSLARESALAAQLTGLDELARAVQADIPRVPREKDLAKLYARCAENLEPIAPWPERLADLSAGLADWAGRTVELLEGGVSVAVECPFPVVGSYLLAVLARSAAEGGRTLGALVPTAVNARALVEIAKSAPGLVAVPAIRISLGTNAYDMSNEVACLLSTLAAAQAPIIAFGSHEQLQAVFGGGQGGANDPLLPALRRAPEVELASLTAFAVRTAGRRAGGLSPAAEEQVHRAALEAVAALHPGTQRRVLPVVASRAVAAWAKGRKTVPQEAARYASAVAAATETLAGLSPRPRAARADEVQSRFAGSLADPALLGYFREHLLAQDAALGELAARLATEGLTRPAHQPLRYCAQGTPGTGKSESAVLLAHRLGVPYVNVDCASMGDFHSACAQLLGSGRGIVGSYQSGRLEQAAKSHGGAVVEVADLDHAVPSVRAALADLFLQILETGEGQSATGAMFSCANLLFAFTMNLPDGMDEAVRKRIGFGRGAAGREIAADVSAHIKRMLSGAFLSRVGTPVVFAPLDGEALALIVERAVRGAVAAAAANVRADIAGVELEPGLGARAVDLLEARVVSCGARALLEHGRSLAAQAFVGLLQSGAALSGRVLRVRFGAEGRLTIGLE